MHRFIRDKTYTKICLNYLLSLGFIITYYNIYNKLLSINCLLRLFAYLTLNYIISQQIHVSFVVFKNSVLNLKTEE
jgi:hypothetical protein